MKTEYIEFDPLLYTADGRTEKSHINITEKSCGNVKAVYLSALPLSANSEKMNGAFNSECAVKIRVSFCKKVQSFMANYLYSEYWCKPFFGKDLSNVPDETQALVIRDEENKFLVLLPVVNDAYKCVFQGDNKGRFFAKYFSWCENIYTCNGLAFVYAYGSRPLKLIEECAKTALRELNSGVRLRSERNYPNMFEYLGWCSWDSFHIGVSESGIIEKCNEFLEKRIPVRWVIIDDMWATIKDFYGQKYDNFEDMISLMYRSAISDFEADPIRFPNGLKECIRKLHCLGMKVGMWHPTTGYWRGIAPNSNAFNKLKTYLKKTSQGYYVPDWHRDKSYMYYSTIHDFFRKCDVDFVKIDNQSMTKRFYKNDAPVGEIAKEFHAGMEASVGEHFNNCVINCMGMASEDMWNRGISPIARCSDDFQPENREWFSKHVLQCAYNSFVQGQFYWCDWDMWWTDDSQAQKNCLMRAISGGPIYISDQLERSRIDVIAPLVMSDGKILRCDRPAMPTDDCLTVDCTKSGTALKLQNMCGKHAVMAVVNIDENNKPVTAEICAEMVDGANDDEYAVYEHYSKELKILKRGEQFNVTLNSNNDYRLYIFAPLHDGFAAIGRIDKLISPASIRCVYENQVILYENGPYAYVLDGKLHVVDK